MNKRIKELVKQAREFATTRHPVSNITLSVNSDKFEQKFAELIVVECAMFVVTELEGKVGSAIADATANRLEEHFGL